MSEKPPIDIPENAESGEEILLSPEAAEAELEAIRQYAEALAANITEMQEELAALEAGKGDQGIIAQKRADIANAEAELSEFPEFIEKSREPAGDFVPKKTKL
ncbi:MAG: hypothetical protein AAB367_02595 [Patescibacteria group bacterium]